MKLLLIVTLFVPAAALAVERAAPAPAGGGYHERLYERYCEKLREGPEAYVQFVRRLQPVHGLTYSDFAPQDAGAPVRANCRVAPDRVAAVHAVLAPEKR